MTLRTKLVMRKEPIKESSSRAEDAIRANGTKKIKKTNSKIFKLIIWPELIVSKLLTLLAEQ